MPLAWDTLRILMPLYMLSINLTVPISLWLKMTLTASNIFIVSEEIYYILYEYGDGRGYDYSDW